MLYCSYKRSSSSDGLLEMMNDYGISAVYDDGSPLSVLHPYRVHICDPST